MRIIALLLTFAAVPLIRQDAEKPPAVKLCYKFVEADRQDKQLVAKREERRLIELWKRLPDWKRAQIEAAQSGSGD